jgi:hypothetical protein
VSGSTPLYFRDRERDPYQRGGSQSPREVSPVRERGEAEEAQQTPLRQYSRESLTYKAARALSSSRRLFGGSIAQEGGKGEDGAAGEGEATDGDGRREAEKSAALMLMNLSVRSPSREKSRGELVAQMQAGREQSAADGEGVDKGEGEMVREAALKLLQGPDEHRSKRRRAASASM